MDPSGPAMSSDYVVCDYIAGEIFGVLFRKATKYHSEVYCCSFRLQLFLNWWCIKLLPVLVFTIWVSQVNCILDLF